MDGKENRIRRVAALIALFAVCVTPALGQSINSNWMRMGLDAAAGIRNVVFRHDEMVGIWSNTWGSLILTNLPGGGRVGIDAFFMDDGMIYFSTDVDFRVGAYDYADDDVLVYTPIDGRFHLWLSGLNEGIPREADVVALAKSTNEWDWCIYSIDIACSNLFIGWVDPNDVVLVAAGGAYVLYDGETDLHIPSYAKIDALHQDKDYLYYSLDSTVVSGSYTGRDEDIWVFSQAGRSIVGVIKGADIEACGDLATLDAGPIDSDGDWLTDFEERSGMDEGCSWFPGSSARLSPNGYTSEWTVVDTDGDLVADGEEAVCGTNPNDPNDYLRVIEQRLRSAELLITWSSVTGRTYDWEASTNLPVFDILLENNLIATGPTMTRTNAGSLRYQAWRVRIEP